MFKSKRILVTGAAGFIGFHLARRLVERGDRVIGLDNINNYYDVRLKFARLAEKGILKRDIKYNRFTMSRICPNYQFLKLNLEDKKNMLRLFRAQKFDVVCHLAAQAGVRYSLENPDAYVQSNLLGFFHILEGCREHPPGHLVFASSSSVYGLNEKLPFSTRDNVDHPISLYAATKKSSELLAHAYSYLFKIPMTGLRFFTAYGPWGRPDMALFKFTEAILAGRPIDVYNRGRMVRDFTYIDDIVEGIVRTLDKPPKPDSRWSGLNPDPSRSKAPYRIYNIGNSKPVKLTDFIAVLEKTLHRKAKKNYLPLQKGDVPATCSDVTDLQKDFGYRPRTKIQEGIEKFIDWYLSYFKK
jgi:UDP-glucuronate 4-epimerase